MPRSPQFRPRPVAAMTLTLACASMAAADVKLITLPIRERVEIQLDHANVTLVEEERFVPLVAGVNDVVFAWANTSIDKDSIQFRCLTDTESINVLSVSYPPGQNSLTWQVASPEATSARVRISYAIGQLDKAYSYRAVATNDESSLRLEQYVQLHNRANETFGIAGMWTGFGERIERPIGINETKRLLAGRFDGVEVRKTYTAELAVSGFIEPARQLVRVPMHYTLHNHQDDGHGTVAFLGEDWAGYTPRDDHMRLYVGVAKDIEVKRTIAKNESTRVFGQLRDYDVVIKYEIENFKDREVVLDLAEHPAFIRNEIRGDTGRPVQWEIGDNGTLREPVADESSNARVLFRVTLPPRGADQKAVKVVQTLHTRIRNEW